MGRIFNKRNGQDGKLTSKPVIEPENVEAKGTNGQRPDQVPQDQQLRNVLMIPHVDINALQLLNALGAKRVGSAIASKDPTEHFSLIEIPDSITVVQSRYARASEFIEAGTDKPVHGIIPSGVFAPDGTLLFHMYRFGGTTSITVGLAWEEIAKHLGVDGLTGQLPQEAITLKDFADPKKFGEKMTLVINGITTLGMIDIEKRAKEELANQLGLKSGSEELEASFKSIKDSGRTELGTINLGRIKVLDIEPSIPGDSQTQDPVAPAALTITDR